MRLITDSSTPPTILAQHTDYPFGREATSTSQDSEPMKFTGHERDLHISWNATADDLDYMHARYRGAITGRFHSVDPVQAGKAKPQTWNRYAYTVGNPLSYVDPGGNKEKPPTAQDKRDVVVIPNTETPIDKDYPANPENQEAVNCHSFCFHAGEGDPRDPANAQTRDMLPKWDNSPADDLREQGFKLLAPDQPNVAGDKVIYGLDLDKNGRMEDSEIKHSATVVRVDGEGNTTRIISKWGQREIMIHHPAVVPASYGELRYYYRKQK